MQANIANVELRVEISKTANANLPSFGDDVTALHELLS
jgi:hypothetical protein